MSSGRPEVLHVGDGVHQCVDCGSYSTGGVPVKHRADCKPGEAERWARHYEEHAREEAQGEAGDTPEGDD